VPKILYMLIVSWSFSLWMRSHAIRWTKWSLLRNFLPIAKQRI